MIILLLIALLLIGVIIIAARKVSKRSLRYLIIAISFIFVMGIAGLIWFVIDWHSPRHWIGIYPIVDASQQNEGLSEFILPRGDYVIAVSRDDYQADDKLIIAYELDIPKEGIRIKNEKEVSLMSVQNYLMDNVKIRNNMARGLLRVKVISPSKGKVCVGLVTDRFAGM